MRNIDPTPAATEGTDPTIEGGVPGDPVIPPVPVVAAPATGPVGLGSLGGLGLGLLTGATAKITAVKSAVTATPPAATTAPAATPYRYCMPTHAVYTFPAPTARISLCVVCQMMRTDMYTEQYSIKEFPKPPVLWRRFHRRCRGFK